MKVEESDAAAWQAVAYCFHGYLEKGKARTTPLSGHGPTLLRAYKFWLKFAARQASADCSDLLRVLGRRLEHTSRNHLRLDQILPVVCGHVLRTLQAVSTGRRKFVPSSAWRDVFKLENQDRSLDAFAAVERLVHFPGAAAYLDALPAGRLRGLSIEQAEVLIPPDDLRCIDTEWCKGGRFNPETAEEIRKRLREEKAAERHEQQREQQREEELARWEADRLVREQAKFPWRFTPPGPTSVDALQSRIREHHASSRDPTPKFLLQELRREFARQGCSASDAHAPAEAARAKAAAVGGEERRARCPWERVPRDPAIEDIEFLLLVARAFQQNDSDVASSIVAEYRWRCSQRPGCRGAQLGAVVARLTVSARAVASSEEEFAQAEEMVAIVRHRSDDKNACPW